MNVVLSYALQSKVTLLLSFGGTVKPQIIVQLESLPESFFFALAEGKSTKHMNKRCYVVAILMVTQFLRDNTIQVDTFPKWPPNFDTYHWVVKIEIRDCSLVTHLAQWQLLTYRN